MNKTIYKIFLPDGNFVRLWFMGEQLEKILKAYRIKYEKEKRGK